MKEYVAPNIEIMHFDIEDIADITDPSGGNASGGTDWG